MRVRWKKKLAFFMAILIAFAMTCGSTPALADTASVESAADLVVYNTKDGTGMWDIELLSYIYCSDLGKNVPNYVKYVAEDAENGWRLAFCTQISSHFISGTNYISKSWKASAMYAELSYAMAHGCAYYGTCSDEAYSTGVWTKDYYVTQTVIYCILSDYGYDGHDISTLSAVSGYEDVYACVLAMYKDVKANAGSDGYGDSPSYAIVAPSSTEMTLTDDGSYYRSGWYSIESTGEIASASISLDGAPDGCTIVYEDSSDPTSRFYIQIPVKKAYAMSKDSITFKVTGSATFQRATAYIYKAQEADAQNITFQQYTTPTETYDSEASVKLSLDTCEISLIKKDAQSANGVSGAVYGVYTDKACTDLVTTMPETDKNGATSVEFVKRQNTYYVKEISAAVNYLIDTSATKVSVSANQVSEVTVTEDEVRGKITVYKVDADTGEFSAQGDASLEGAVYGLYAREDIVHPDGTTGVLYEAGTLLEEQAFSSEGVITFEDLYLGSYYIKEISEPEGYCLDDTEYDVELSYENDTTAVVEVTVTAEETVKKQAFQIIKVSTDGAAEETTLVSGAEFTVKLLSEVEAVGWDAATTYDTLITDADGYAISIELPYGTYVVRETRTPAELLPIDDFTVTVSEDSRIAQTWRVYNDAPFQAYIRLIKKDVDTGEIVLLGGTTFKIRNTDTGEDVTMKVGSTYVSTFTTDESGMVTTPLKLSAGNYEVYEITAPEGYVVRTESIAFTVSSNGAYETDADGDFVVEVEIENKQQYGSVTIYKRGEVLTGITTDTSLWKKILSFWIGDATLTEYETIDFVYEEQFLEGCVFQIICDEDIYTADNQRTEDGTRVLATYQGVDLAEGAVVATVTTDENGQASVQDLPLGSYHLVEVSTVDGYVKNTTEEAFVLAYAGQEVEIVPYEATYVNDRQKVALSLLKTSSVEELAVAGAVYGLYSGADILAGNGDVLVEADTLIEVGQTDEDGCILFTADLPLSTYYIVELEAAEGYLLDEEIYWLDATYQGQDVELIALQLDVTDEPTIVELRKTDITTGEEIPGASMQLLDSEGNLIEEWISTTESHVIYALAAGTYILREESAPEGYVVASEITFEVLETGEVQTVTMCDETAKGRLLLTKTDSETKEALEGVAFALCDSEGNVLETLLTDATGFAESSLYEIATFEQGVYVEALTYYLVETQAQEGYILDETQYPVVFTYRDDQTAVIEVSMELTNEQEPVEEIEEEVEEVEEAATGDGNEKAIVVSVAAMAAAIGALLCIRRRRRQ